MPLLWRPVAVVLASFGFLWLPLASFGGALIGRGIYRLSWLVMAHVVLFFCLS
jgi:hypothetical protein